MAGRFGREPGGIRSLRRLIAEHKEAIEYDLIALGLRLDWLSDERLSWRDLLVIANQSPRSTALYRAFHPDEWSWGLTEQLLAANFDALQVGNWQRQALPNAPRPKPLQRPGVEPESKTYGREPVPMDEMARRLGWEVP